MGQIRFDRLTAPTAAFVPTSNPLYPDYGRRLEYLQPTDLSAGGIPYVYDKGLEQQQRITLGWRNMASADYQSLLLFLDRVRGSRYDFWYTDPWGEVAAARIVNPGEIESAPVAYGRESVTIELLRDNVPKATGTVTLANSRISLTAGFGMLDFTAAGVLTGNTNKRIDVIDSAGRRISGMIGAAGAGEAIDTNVLVNPGFPSDTSSWEAINSTLASVAGGQSGNCLEITRVSSNYQGANQTVTAIIGRLYRGRAHVKSGSSGNEAFELSIGPDLVLKSGTSTGGWIQQTGYFTAVATSHTMRLRKMTGTAGTMLFDSALLQPVTVMAATGVTIVSTPAGATANWFYADPLFNPNDPAGFTYKIYGCT